MENIYNLVLDLKQKITQTEIVIPQLDNNTHKFSMKVTQNGDEYVLEDEITSELAILKTDGQFVVLPAQKMGSTYTATLTEQALTTAGITKAELRFKKNDELLTSTQFNFLVREVIVNNEKIKSTSEYKALEGLINEAKAMEESLKKGEAVLGDVNKIKEDLAVIKESILNKSKELNDKLASVDEKINEINSCITNAETVLNNFENSQNKIDNLSNLLKELSKIQLTLDELNKSINNANTQKTELNASIESAKTEKSNLDTKIADGKQTATNLENKTSAANTTQSQLEQANTAATSTKQSLESATATANDTRAKLDNSNRLGNTLSSDLSNKINQGGNLNSSLAASISSASTAKSNLDGSITNAESTNTSLTATDTEAKNTESLIRDLMNQLGKTENEVKQIIASGDLSKYVTDPKLQEALKSYAKKTEVVTSVNGQKGDMMVDFFRCDDTRNQNYAPKDYLLNGARYKRNTITTSQFEFKTCKVVGVDKLITQTFCVVNTIVLWNQVSGGLPMQIAYGNGVMAVRNGVDENTWGEWQKVSTTDDLSGYATKADLQGIDVTSQLADYVKKVEGKGLSTNDYSNADKAKVNNIPANPKYTDTVTSINGKTGAITKADIVALGIPSQDTNTTYGLASQSSNGLMSAADKKRLDNIKEQVALTETQYNALSSSQQNDSTKIYFIKA